MNARQKIDNWPRAAVFDCDGLLVDSAICWERAYEQIARQHNATIDDVDLDSLAGASIASAATALGRSLGVSVAERTLRRTLNDSFAALSPPALPGAKAIVAGLGTRMPLAVASNAPRDLVVDVLNRLGICDAFEAVVSAEDTSAHKPAPDVYLEACRRIGVAAHDAIAFEDSSAGAQAARTAGLLVVAVPLSPGIRIEADLTVSRLDDPRLLKYLGLDLAIRTEDGNSTPSREA